MSDRSHDPYEILGIPDFRRIVVTRFTLTMALQMQAVIVGWQLYDITGDTFALGLTGLAEAIPALSVALYAGHVADKFNRKRIVLAGLSVLVICSLSLLGLSFDVGGGLARFGTMAIYAVIFLSGLARGFFGPAMFAVMAQVVPRHLYAKSAAWNSGTWQSAAVAGPAIGGLVYGYFGVSAAYALDAVLTVVSLITVAGVAPVFPEISEAKESIVDSLLSGVRFVFRDQIILASLGLDLFAVLFGGAVALLPAFAKDVLHTGPEGVGYLRAAPALGAAVVALAMVHRPLKGDVGKLLLKVVAGFGIAMIVFGLSTNYYLSLAALALSGGLDSVSVIIRSTIIQVRTPDRMRGRVSSVNTMFIGSSNEIGAFESGLVAKLMGVVPSVVFGGCMTLVTVLAIAWRAPRLRGLRSDELLGTSDTHN